MILSKGLTHRNKRLAISVVNSQTMPQTLPELIGGMGLQTRSGQVVTPENSKNVATAYRCANLISDDIAKMPLQTFISRAPGEIERMPHPERIAPHGAAFRGSSTRVPHRRRLCHVARSCRASIPTRSLQAACH